MTIRKSVKGTLITAGVLAGGVVAFVVASVGAIILVVLLGLWIAARVAGAASRLMP